MSETPVCEVCGRGYTEDEGHLTGPRGDAACYRLGFERARAALSAAEKRQELAEAVAAGATHNMRALENGLAAAEKREARLREALEPLQRARHTWHCDPDAADEKYFDTTPLHDSLCAAARVALELASAASEAQPPPASPMPIASSTQEGEK